MGGGGSAASAHDAHAGLQQGTDDCGHFFWRCGVARLAIDDFRRTCVGLEDYRDASRNLHDLSREFEPTAQAIWNWVRQADRDEGH